MKSNWNKVNENNEVLELNGMVYWFNVRYKKVLIVKVDYKNMKIVDADWFDKPKARKAFAALLNKGYVKGVFSKDVREDFEVMFMDYKRGLGWL